MLTSNQGICVASSQMACSWQLLMLRMRMLSCLPLQKDLFLVKEYGLVRKKKRIINQNLHHQIRYPLIYADLSCLSKQLCSSARNAYLHLGCPSDLLNCFIVQVIVFSAIFSPSPNVHGTRKTIKGDKKRKNTCRKKIT